MRILVVEPRLDDNGAVRVTLDRAARWAAAGDDVTLFVFSQVSFVPTAPVPPSLTLVHPTARPRRDQVVWAAAVARLTALAREADVVVAGREIDVGLLLAAGVSHLVRRPFAVTVQSSIDRALADHVAPRSRRLVTSALRSADLAVCVSAGLVPGLTALGLPGQRTAVVVNGVDVEDVRRRALLPPAVDLPEEPFVVASGRLTRQKGFDLLLEAHARALDRGAPPHSVVVLGDGPDRAALEARARELGVADSFRMPGHLAEPHAVVARADLFALPSRWEGLGLSLVEAMACGTPLLAADCVSGPGEVLDRGRYGRLLPPEDVDALADALVDHLRDPEPLRAAAAAAGATVGQRFDAAAAAAHHRALLYGLARPAAGAT